MSDTVFVNMKPYGVSGRVVRTSSGKLVAQVKSGSGFRRASTNQAVPLFRNALAVKLLQEGDPVVAWDGSRLVKGSYAGTLGGEYLARVGSMDVLTLCILPFDIAVEEGIWSFQEGMPVAAYDGLDWVRATWLAFEETGLRGVHVVEVDGVRETCDRAHPLADAIRMGIPIRCKPTGEV